MLIKCEINELLFCFILFSCKLIYSYHKQTPPPLSKVIRDDTIRGKYHTMHRGILVLIIILASVNGSESSLIYQVG